MILGRTGFDISRIAFGAGPIPQLMTSADDAHQQSVVERAIQLGVNWFDTAATYGDGASETQLGGALEVHRDRVYLATKVRVSPDQLGDIRGAIRASVEGSLERLRTNRIDLLQLHNSITLERGDQPTSLAPADVLGEVWREFDRLRSERLIRFLGLTGIGAPSSLAAVVNSGEFDAIQLPFNLANPSAGVKAPDGYRESDYGNIIASCAEQQMGVLAIRIFAGGALLGLPPSPHTHKTKFFPLDLYQRDVERASRLQQILPDEMTIAEAAVRFSLSHDHVHAAIVGFSAIEHVDQAASFAERGPLPLDLYEQLAAAAMNP